MPTIIPIEQIERQILLIRGHKALLDAHLAVLDPGADDEATQ